MALYFGSNKVKIAIENSVCVAPFFSNIVFGGFKLISLDEYALQDANGLYLTVKGESD